MTSIMVTIMGVTPTITPYRKAAMTAKSPRNLLCRLCRPDRCDPEKAAP